MFNVVMTLTCSFIYDTTYHWGALHRGFSALLPSSRIGLAVVVILRPASHSMTIFFLEKQERDKSANFDRAISA
jgi:hypothetical protein